MKAGEWPISGPGYETVLDRVEMDVIHMSGIVAFVADRVFPIAPLPDAALAPPRHDCRPLLDVRQ